MLERKRDLLPLGFVSHGSVCLFQETPDIQSLGEFYDPGKPGHEPWGLGITLVGDTLYYADWGAGLIIVNAANPAAMSALVTYPNNHANYEVAVATNVSIGGTTRGKVAFLGGDMGIDVLDITDLAASEVLHRVSTRFEADDSVHGIVFDPATGLGYVADNKEQALTVVRLAD